MLSASSSSSTSLIEKNCTIMTTYGSLTEKGEPWIIDSRATDHMTRCEKMFTAYAPSPGNHRVKIADGSFSVIASVGTIKISPNISLQAVHVPNLSCNLLSISEITKDLNCVVNFSPSVCVFQDQISGKRIGSAREFDGLYYFESASSMGGHVQLTVGNSSLSRSQQIMLLHCRLGHPNFVYLKYLFPSLFQKHDSFQCEVCRLAKHKCVFFPP